MFCQQSSTRELHDLRIQSLTPAPGSHFGEGQHNNLLRLLRMVEEELCGRCQLSTVAEYVVPYPRPKWRNIASGAPPKSQ